MPFPNTFTHEIDTGPIKGGINVSNPWATPPRRARAAVPTPRVEDEESQIARELLGERIESAPPMPDDLGASERAGVRSQLDRLDRLGPEAAAAPNVNVNVPSTGRTRLGSGDSMRDTLSALGPEFSAEAEKMAAAKPAPRSMVGFNHTTGQAFTAQPGKTVRGGDLQLMMQRVAADKLRAIEEKKAQTGFEHQRDLATAPIKETFAGKGGLMDKEAGIERERTRDQRAYDAPVRGQQLRKGEAEARVAEASGKRAVADVEAAPTSDELRADELMELAKTVRDPALAAKLRRVAATQGSVAKGLPGDARNDVTAALAQPDVADEDRRMTEMTTTPRFQSFMSRAKRAQPYFAGMRTGTAEAALNKYVREYAPIAERYGVSRESLAALMRGELGME